MEEGTGLLVLDSLQEICHPQREPMLAPAAIIRLHWSNLNCASNKLMAFPSSLGKCSELTELKVSSNSLTALPYELMFCAKLMNLDLEDSNITILPNHLLSTYTMRTELNAANNFVIEIPESVGKLSRLIHLDLHRKRISSIAGCSSLADFYLGDMQSFSFGLRLIKQ